MQEQNTQVMQETIGWIDKFIVASSSTKNKYAKMGLDSSKIKVLGSARFSPKWCKTYFQLIGDSTLFRDPNYTKIVFFDHSTRYRSHPDEIVNWLTFKYIEDVLTKDEALEILNQNQKHKEERVKILLKEGYPAYTTAAGWLGYSDEKIIDLCNKYMKQGWRHFKIKVGNDLEGDVKRLEIIRNAVGEKCSIMVDANQQWSVSQSIKHINAYKKFNLLFVEEPTSPDDVMGFKKIKKAVGNVNLATGEACGGRIMFKQFLESGGMDICQIDSCRLGSINEILVVLLMAHKLKIPVFPHAGGVGLCEYVQHLCMLDYVLINGEKDSKVVEYQDSLHEHFKFPCVINNSNYMPPNDNGYSIEMKQDSIDTYSYPNGDYWIKNK